MKYIIIIMLLLSIGCNDKEKAPEPPEPDCHCGQVERWGGDSWETSTGRQITWGYRITNNCTNAPWVFKSRTEIRESEYCRGYQW